MTSNIGDAASTSADVSYKNVFENISSRIFVDVATAGIWRYVIYRLITWSAIGLLMEIIARFVNGS
jgi:hypothetical protein